MHAFLPARNNSYPEGLTQLPLPTVQSGEGKCYTSAPTDPTIVLPRTSIESAHPMNYCKKNNTRHRNSTS
jgi:hypothetical protein